MTVDVTTIRDLLAFEDPSGVVSLYTEHLPAQASSAPTSPLEIRNRTKDLLATLDADLARKVRERLDAAAADVEHLVDPATSGRGRALFLGVDSGRVESFSVQLPFRHRVIHHAQPFVRPLVAAVDEGRPALLVLADAKGVRLARWALGAITDVERRDFELGDAQLADIGDMKGPSGRPDQRSNDHKDAMGDRIDANRDRFLKSVAEQVRQLRSEDRFDRVLIAGPARIRAELCDGMASESGLTVLESDQTLIEASTEKLMDACWNILRSDHRDRERELVAMARDRAGAGGNGVLGVAGTLQALNEGRVQHLLFSDEVSFPGYVDDAGMLYTTAGNDGARRETPLLVEHMVERALTTGAQVTPVDEDVAEELGSDGGVAALTRW